MGVLVAISVAILCALGLWQVQRLTWKTNLIERVNARVAAAAVAPPPRPVWSRVNAQDDEYRHVTLRGHFLNAREVQVYALTDYGAGYWIMTPFVTGDGMTVYVNRGYVPLDRQKPDTRPAGLINGDVAITGLLRLSETKGWLFSQPNDPGHDLWYRRDVAQMARRYAVGTVAPYFIDADATPNPGGWPKGGLTKTRFPNSHLAYALTWFSLAALLAGTFIWLGWFRKPRPDDDA